MRVSGVNIFSYDNKSANRQRNGYADLGLLRISSATMPEDTFVKTLSFKAGLPSGIPIKTHGQYRYLTKEHDIHCFYCKRLLLYAGTLQDMLDSGVFSGPIKDFVEKVKPYRKVMKKGQGDVFDQIEKYAKKSPQTHLSEIVQFLYQNSIKRLVRTQAKIFKKLMDESASLPPDREQSFRKFMKNQHKRLYEKAYKEDFNPEKFAYKMSKMIPSIPNAELRAYLSRITEPMSDPIFANKDSVIPSELANRISKSKAAKFRTANEFSEYVIYRVQKIGERLDRQDIVRLCEISKRMIEGKNVIIQFSNKDFMHDLVKKELASIKGTPLYYRMVYLANKLPNSSSSMRSFVAKHRYSNSDTIGYKLLEPSIATVEHVKARANGGVDDLTNCVLACRADNNERGSMPQYLYMNKWNKRNPQAFFNDIINIANKEHLISISDIKGMSQTVFDGGHVKVDTSKLK